MARRERKTEHYLPRELWAEIFARLPVKTLLRFRCVCKTWRSSIENPNFALKHLNFYKNDPNNDHLLTLETPEPYTEIKSTIRKGTNFDRIVKIGLGFNSYEEFDLVGYVNGVLCLKIYREHELLEIVLSNPSIRKTISVPLPQMSNFQKGKSQQDDRLFVDISFGFDTQKNDFKVVAMGYPFKEEEPGFYVFDRVPNLFEVYAQSAGSWRNVSISSIRDNMLWCWRFPKLFVNGAVHLLGEDSNCSHKCTHLIAFDMGNEVLRYMELPECGGQSDLRFRIPLVYGESLALLDTFETFFCIWVMKEYGIRESWVRQYKISVSLNPGSFVYVRGSVVYLRKDGDLFYVPWSDKGLMICNVRSAETRCLTKNNPDSLCFLDTYVESLLLLK